MMSQKYAEMERRLTAALQEAQWLKVDRDSLKAMVGALVMASENQKLFISHRDLQAYRGRNLQFMTDIENRRIVVTLL